MLIVAQGPFHWGLYFAISVGTLEYLHAVQIEIGGGYCHRSELWAAGSPRSVAPATKQLLARS